MTDNKKFGEYGTGTRTKRRRTFWLAVAVLIGLAGVFAVFRQSGSGEKSEPSNVGTTTAPGVVLTSKQLNEIRVESVHEQVIDLNLEATGKISFNEDRLTPVLAPYPGRVVELLANKGDVVKAGAALLVIESADLVTAVNDLVQAHAEIDKSRIAVDVAQKSADRARRLHGQEALSTKDLQAAESEQARAEEDYRRAESALSVIHSRLVLLGKSEDEIAQLENSYKNPSAEASTAQKNVKSDAIDRRIVIRAPIGGTIVDRKVGLGQYIRTDSSDPLYLITDLSSVWVTVDIYENDLPRIRVGAPVDISVAAYPAQRFPARIAAISPIVDATTRTVKMRCLVPNSTGLLKPEMFARIRVAEGVKQKVLMVPSAAILTEGERSYVLVEEAAGHFSRREVKSGPEIDGNTAVEEGLRPSDRVVTKGVLLVGNLEGSRP